MEVLLHDEQEIEEWNSFFHETGNSDFNQRFHIPEPQNHANSRHGHLIEAKIDDCVRDVDVVVHSGFTATQRRQKIRSIAQNIPSSKLEPLMRGMFLVVQLRPDWEQYPHDFVIAEIQEDISHIDTTKEDAKFKVLVYCFSSLTNISAKIFPWRGSGGGGLWITEVERSMVKAIAEIQFF